MKIKLKEARSTKLTKAADVLIMKQRGAVGSESLFTQIASKGLAKL
jgi:hypothetical protein